MGQVYKTWVPNVSGALSFSMLGTGTYPSPAWRANVGDQFKRYIVSYQKRPLLDAVIPIIAKMTGISGDFVCTCVASCSDNPSDTFDTLTGRLFIFHDLKLWKKHARKAINDAQSLLWDYSQKCEIGLNNQLESYFEGNYQNLSDLLPRLSSYFVDFTVQRNGVTTLTCPDNIADLVSPDAPEFPADSVQKLHIEKIVCSQLFFFLKDLCHNHQHHPPKSDTLVDVHAFLGDDVEWRSKILRVLYRKIIEFKRDSRPESYNSSLGILIYAKAFRGISVKEVQGIEIPPIVQDELLENSIKVGFNNCWHKIQTKELHESSKYSRYTALWTLVLTIALLLSITGYKVSNPDIVLVHFGCVLARHTFPIVSFIIVCYWLKNLRFRGKLNIADNRLIRRVLLILQPLNQTMAAFIVIFIGLLSFTVTLIVLFYLYLR